ncbi:hypothetical protein ACFFOM_12070 [Microlunatus capsulatus]|uniref:Zinc ribbon domain-containing protein n=1 Tax=Microlunatus capsulatus TaxID=99117 RepID=A0ABS4Z8Y7_9ACTN|nr:hypothetical protein [Microlunatus capsulatus]MBP2417519.1 hypothetical protein [Microlunatus capsulatus]
MITVAGASGLDPVVGLPEGVPSALLAAVGDRHRGPVLVLSPRHAARGAREQAHVLVAARPDLRVGVLVLDHHALTLLLAGRLAAGPAAADDPGRAVALVRSVAARSRSLVWYPRAGGRAGAWDGTPQPVPAGARLRSLLGRPGYLAEVGAAGLLPARLGLGPDAGAAGAAVLHSAGPLPDALARHLDGRAGTAVDAGPAPGCPYASPGSVELTLLVAPTGPVLPGPACPVCGAGTGAAGCVFCGTAAVPAALPPVAPAPPAPAPPAPPVPATGPAPARPLVPAGGSA